MRGMILSIASCVVLSGCGVGSSDAASGQKLTTVDQVPPECVSYFHKLSGGDKNAFDKDIAAWTPKDPPLTVDQCKQLDAEMPAGQGSN